MSKSFQISSFECHIHTQNLIPETVQKGTCIFREPTRSLNSIKNNYRVFHDGFLTSNQSSTYFAKLYRSRRKYFDHNKFFENFLLFLLKKDEFEAASCVLFILAICLILIFLTAESN